MHPNTEKWIELIEGSVGDTVRQGLEEHLAECEGCRKREREIRHLLETMASDRLLEPSPIALSSAKQALRPSAHEPSLPAWARNLRQRMARLVFDTLTNREEAFAGARSSSVARRLRFEEKRVELDVLVEVAGDGRRLTAQLLSLDPEPRPLAHARILISAGGAIETDRETDAYGAFVKEVAVAGNIEIRVMSEGRLVVFRLPDL